MVMQKTSELIWQDAQHQVLFGLIEKIAAEPFDPRVLVELENYADQHFTLEEMYMEKLGFPLAEEHLQAHLQFRTEFRDMQKIDPEQYEILRTHFSRYLYEWLKKHVLGIDKKSWKHLFCSHLPSKCLYRLPFNRRL